jgi:hypothetical protein
MVLRGNSRGFTLVEILFGLGILTIALMALMQSTVAMGRLDSSIRTRGSFHQTMTEIQMVLGKSDSCAKAIVDNGKTFDPDPITGVFPQNLDSITVGTGAGGLVIASTAAPAKNGFRISAVRFTNTPAFANLGSNEYIVNMEVVGIPSDPFGLVGGSTLKRDFKMRLTIDPGTKKITKCSTSSDEDGAGLHGSVPFSTPGTTNWTVPAGVSTVTVEIWGAGGGGSGAAGADSNYGAGGGGGGYVKKVCTVTPASVVAVAIGAGGVGGAGGGLGYGYSGAGGTGGNSCFGSCGCAAGGLGGSATCPKVSYGGGPSCGAAPGGAGGAGVISGNAGTAGANTTQGIGGTGFGGVGRGGNGGTSVDTCACGVEEGYAGGTGTNGIVIVTY